MVEVKYYMSQPIDMALGHRKQPPGFELNVEPLDSSYVDERPPPIVKLEYV